MATTTVSYGSITLTDITDVGELSIYPKSNLPQSVIYSPDQNSFTPNWGSSNLILSPSIWYGGEQLSTTDNLVTVTWSRREGIGAVTPLITGENVSDGTMVVSGETIPKGTLVVNQNKFTDSSTMITYIVTVSYQEPTISQALTAQGEITFTMTKQASSVKSATITGESIFKYNGDGTIKGASTITLNGRVTGSGVNISAWQYQQANGTWATYPNSGTNPTLTVRENDSVFTNDKCIIRLYTTDEDIYDYHTITKLRDGAAGTDTVSAVLTNEDQMIPYSGDTGDFSSAVSRLIIYESGVDVTNQWTITHPNDMMSNVTFTTSTTTTTNDTVTITGLTGSSGYVTFKAEKTGKTPLIKQFSVVKVASGADGKSPVIYSLEPSTLALNKTIGITPTFTPSSVRFYAYQTKEQTKSIYNGRFKIYENVLAKDITSSTQAKYTSGSDESTGYHDYTPSSSCTSIVCILYESGGTSTKLDTQTIAVTTDGQTGSKGDKGNDGIDALNIIVGNSYDGIPVNSYGNTTSAYPIIIPFAGYQGTEKVATTVVNPPTLFGITPTTTNATTSVDGSIQYVIPVGTSITNDNGVVTFTFNFTQANKTVTYDYSWGKARQGEKGDKGDTAQWYYGELLTHTTGTATLPISLTDDVIVGAMYLNTSIGTCYKCTEISSLNATWTYAGNIAEGIEIVGTNLVPLSKNLKSFTAENLTRSTVIYTDDYCTITNTYGDTRYGVYYDIDVESGLTYTLSFQASDVSGTNINYGVGNRTPDQTASWNTITDGYKDIVDGNNVCTFTIPDTVTKIRIYFGAGSLNGTMTISNLKLETGDKATEWTPAIEDIQYAMKVATNYLSMDETGIMVADMNDGEQTPSEATGNNVFIDNTSVNIRDGQTTLASFGVDGMQIGLSDESHTTQDYHSWKMIDKEGNSYVHISDLRDTTGWAIFEESYVPIVNFDMGPEPCEYAIELAFPVNYNSDIISAEINGTPVESWEMLGSVKPFEYIKLTPLPSSNDNVTIKYKSSNSALKAYTFGTRQDSSVLGGFSFAEGYNTVARGRCSHAEGYQCKAIGYYSHAEGSGSTANGRGAHAESSGDAYGDYSHAEGLASAYGHYSHAEGSGGAHGQYSHSQNQSTLAYGDAQTSIGRWNIADNNNTYALIIGNGTQSARSNALTVKWDGTLTAGNGFSTANTALTISKVISTTYMTDAQFKRLKAYKKNGMLYLCFNAEFTSTGYNSSSDFTTIGKITGWNAVCEILASIPKQTDGSKIVTLLVRPGGEIQIYSAATISGWYRTSVCVPCSS